jgi:tetratricopeptide (TPR) repeat protein
VIESIFIGWVAGELLGFIKNTILKNIKPGYESNAIIEKTHKALENAYKRFFAKYKKQFGIRSKSFLSRQDNIKLFLQRIYLDHRELKPEDLNPHGKGNVPKATPEALAFIIDAFEKEIHNDPELIEEIEKIKHYRKIDAIDKRTQRIEKNLNHHQLSKQNDLPHFLTPLPPWNTDLVGRDADLKELIKRLKSNRPLLLVNGLGGIGKTELCKRFIHEHHQQYGHVAWIDYSHSLMDSITTALARPGAKLVQATGNETTEQLFDAIMDRLYNLDDSLLLIIDNIEDQKDPYLELLLGLSATVIVNSRLKLEGFHEMTLDFLSAEACLELFYRYYEMQKDDECAAGIIELCGCHTLTVELLARTAQNANKSIRWLYDELKAKGFNLNEVIQDRVHTFWHDTKEKKKFFNHLLTIFDLSGVTAEEKRVLTNLAVLPAMYTPMEWLREWLKLEHNEAFCGLAEKGWLRREKDTIFMHQVIQETVRHHHLPDAKNCNELIVSLGNKLFLKPEENPIDKKPYVVFADSLLRHVHDMDEELATLANNLSARYLNYGQLPEALEFQQKALTIKKSVLGENHPSLATSYNNLSLIYQDMGKLEPALEFQQKAVTIRESVLDENHPDLAQSYNNLSMIYKDMGKLEPARELAEKAVAILTTLFPDGHPNLDIMKENLNSLY